MTRYYVNFRKDFKYISRCVYRSQVITYGFFIYYNTRECLLRKGTFNNNQGYVSDTLPIVKYARIATRIIHPSKVTV